MVRLIRAELVRLARPTTISCELHIRSVTRYISVAYCLSNSKDVSFKPSAAAAFFRATWNYLPTAILRPIEFMPINPFKRMHDLRNLFARYGSQILREQRIEVDVEKPSNSKDVMSILSRCPPLLPLLKGPADFPASSQGQRFCRSEDAPHGRRAYGGDVHAHACGP